jgi:hypothetical protein
MLGFVTVDWFFPGMGRIFRAIGRLMLKMFEGTDCVLSRHRDFASTFVAVSIERVAATLFGFPVDAACAHLFEGGKEMISIIFVCVFYSKVVDDKSKDNWSTFVLPESGSDIYGAAAMRLEEYLEAVIGKSAGLG